MESIQIERLSEDVASRISTATVVASLEGAVRQLVDNALDAGATSIEIRANENGFNSIEVADNGSGIDPENFDKICKPHHTSKLTDLTGFQNLETLGFRGQALNALCALGSLTIITRSAASLLGTKMIFDHKGVQISRSSVARQVGTSITVEALFKTLPVRRKEFEKNSKREFNKVLSCVQCFSLSRPDVRFICSNTINGKCSQLVSTSGKGNIEDVIGNLFGGRVEKTKFLEVRRTLPDEDICSIYGLSTMNTDDYKDLQITAYISSCEPGFGRSSVDRQFVYINRRPIEYGKVIATVNEIYKQYNKKQYPTLVLFIAVPPSSIDVNVTPDKRTIFFDKEKQLLALIRASLKATFEDVLSAVDSAIENKTQSAGGFTQTGVPSVFDFLKDMSVSAKKRPGSFAGACQKRSKVSAEHNRPLRDFLINTPAVMIEEDDEVPPEASSIQKPKLKLIQHELSPEPSQTASAMDFTVTEVCQRPDYTVKEGVLPIEDTPEPSQTASAMDFTVTEVRPRRDCTIVERISPVEDDVLLETSQSSFLMDFTITEAGDQPDYTIKEKISPVKDFSSQTLNEMSRGLDSHNPRIDDVVLDVVEKRINIEDRRKTTPVKEIDDIPSQMSQSCFWRAQQKVKFNKTAFMERMHQLRNKGLSKTELPSQVPEFHAAANNQDEAEAELSRRLSKTDFQRMTVVGQFNKAFIISRLDDQLFIVDQHAADEKYNFERFQRKARIDTQVLLRPQLLDFGRVQEMVINDNAKIFEANGFKFEFREDESGCSHAYLAGIPVIYSRQFDKRDVDEMISVLRDFPGQMCRPAKTRAIFASRACRKSVMVGTSLSRTTMQTIVENLGTLTQPWNCPHGRPTLRHLLNLSRYQEKFEISK